MKSGDSGIVIGVKEHDGEFLRYLNSQNISLGTELLVKERYLYDNSLCIEIGGKEHLVSEKVSKNIYVKRQ